MGGANGAGRAAILVVDDHASLRRAIRALLEQSGFDVIEACHGGEALAAYRWHEPSLILLDLEMPVVNGWTFLRVAERAGIDTPVIIVSSSADAQATSKAPCVVGVLPKPFDPDALLDAVRRAVRAI